MKYYLYSCTHPAHFHTWQIILPEKLNKSLRFETVWLKDNAGAWQLCGDGWDILTGDQYKLIKELSSDELFTFLL